MMKIQKVMMSMLGCMALLTVQTADAVPTITDITAKQRYPWNGKVDITVSFSGASNDVANLDCSFKATDSDTQAELSVEHISRVGAVDSGSGTTWTRKFVWDADVDVGEVKIDDVVLTIDAMRCGCVQLWEGGPYWSECNVGAAQSEDTGYYFMWGDTMGYKRVGNQWDAVDGSKKNFSFIKENCPNYGMNNSRLQLAGYIDSTGNLQANHDAATMHLGAPWRMPTGSELAALFSKCTRTWIARNGVYGVLLTGEGDYSTKSIFLPAGGYGKGSDLTGKPGSPNEYYSYGYYLSSSPHFDSAQGFYDATNISFYYGGYTIAPYAYNNRWMGETVRPVFADLPSVATTHLAVDCRAGARTVSLDGEDLRYDVGWFENGSEARIVDNGANIAKGDCGTKHWMPIDYGLHRLQLTVLDNGGVRVGSADAYFAYCKVEGVIAIPDGWVEVPDGLFRNCDWLTSVMIPGCVTTISSTAFAGCRGLREVLTDYGDSERIKGLLTSAGVDLSEVSVIEWQLPWPVVMPAGAEFEGASQEVTISCATEETTVYYTLDGSEPSMANGHVYKGPFNIYDSVTVKAIAVKDGWKDSAVASAAFTKNNGLSAAINMYDYLPDNDASAPWTVDTEVSHDGVSSVRSGTVGHNGSTVMMVSVRGRGRLSFWWKSECEEYDEDYYDYGAFRIGSEAEPRVRIAGKTGWKREVIEFDTTGKHTCKWEYHKDDSESIPRDCIWVDQVQWLPYEENEHDHTLTTDVPVPYLWLDFYGLGIETDFETAAKMSIGKVDGAGHALSVEDDYVAGTDPTNVSSKLTATIKMGADGKPIVSWKPSLNGENDDGSGIREGVRKYNVYGRCDLGNEEENWSRVAEGREENFRFFKVSVEMP